MTEETEKDETECVSHNEPGKLQKALKKYILMQNEKRQIEAEEEARRVKREIELEARKKASETTDETGNIPYDINVALAPLYAKKAVLCNLLKNSVENLKNHPDNFKFFGSDVAKLASLGIIVEIPESFKDQSADVPVSTQSKESLPSPSLVNQIPTPNQHQTRKRHSPSPPVYEFKRAALSAFEKLEESRHGEYPGRGYAWNKPVTQTTGYSFYPAPSSVSYTVSSIPMPGASPYPYAAITATSAETIHKPQPQQPVQSHAFRPTSQQPVSVSQANIPYLVEHGKQSQVYPEEKYLIVRPPTHIQMHGAPIPIHQPPQGVKLGSITSGYPIRSAGPSSNQITGHPPPQSMQQQSQHPAQNVQQSTQHQQSQSHRQTHIHPSLPQHAAVQQPPPQLPPAAFQQQIHHLPHHSQQPALHIQQQQSQTGQRQPNPHAVYPHHLYYHNLQQQIIHPQHRPATVSAAAQQSTNVQHPQSQPTSQHSHGPQQSLPPGQFQQAHHLPSHHSQQASHLHQQQQPGHSPQAHIMPAHLSHRHAQQQQQQQPHVLHHPQHHIQVRQPQPVSHQQSSMHAQHPYPQHQHPHSKSTHPHAPPHPHPQQQHQHMAHGKLHQPQHVQQVSQQQIQSQQGYPHPQMQSQQQQQSQQAQTLLQMHHHNMQSQQQSHLQQSHHQEQQAQGQQSHQQGQVQRQSPSQPVSSSQSVIRNYAV